MAELELPELVLETNQHGGAFWRGKAKPTEVRAFTLACIQEPQLRRERTLTEVATLA